MSPGDRPGAASAAYERGFVTGANTVAGCLIVVGLMAILGAAIGLLLATVVAGVAWTGWLNRRRARSAAGPFPEAELDSQVERVRVLPAAPAELPIEQLFLAWRHSYTALLDTDPGSAREHIVAIRAGYLDELERRDEQGFSRWLETGARAGSDPGRYLDPAG